MDHKRGRSQSRKFRSGRTRTWRPQLCGSKLWLWNAACQPGSDDLFYAPIGLEATHPKDQRVGSVFNAGRFASLRATGFWSSPAEDFSNPTKHSGFSLSWSIYRCDRPVKVQTPSSTYLGSFRRAQRPIPRILATETFYPLAVHSRIWVFMEICHLYYSLQRANLFFSQDFEPAVTRGQLLWGWPWKRFWIVSETLKPSKKHAKTKTKKLLKMPTSKSTRQLRLPKLVYQQSVPGGLVPPGVLTN